MLVSLKIFGNPDRKIILMSVIVLGTFVYCLFWFKVVPMPGCDFPLPRPDECPWWKAFGLNAFNTVSSVGVGSTALSETPMVGSDLDINISMSLGAVLAVLTVLIICASVFGTWLILRVRSLLGSG